MTVAVGAPSIGGLRCGVEHRAHGDAGYLRAGALVVLIVLAVAGCSGSAAPAPSATPATSSAQTAGVYLVAEHGGRVGHDLVALDLHTGKVRWRKGIDLPGATPAAMQQRGALAIAGGCVWVSFGAQFGDCSNYQGRRRVIPGRRRDGICSQASPAPVQEPATGDAPPVGRPRAEPRRLATPRPRVWPGLAYR